MDQSITTHEKLLLDLLAVIHRDGGQHTDDVGLVESVDDAMEKIIDSHQSEEQYPTGPDRIKVSIWPHKDDAMLICRYAAELDAARQDAALRVIFGCDAPE